MNRFTHFELPAKDIEAASKFYSSVFGWKIDKWEGPIDYYTITTGDRESPGINGGFYTPSRKLRGTINTMDVEDIDGLVEKIVENGGTIVYPKYLIPGAGWLVYAKDTQGVLFGMMEAVEPMQG